MSASPFARGFSGISVAIYKNSEVKRFVQIKIFTSNMRTATSDGMEAQVLLPEADLLVQGPPLSVV